MRKNFPTPPLIPRGQRRPQMEGIFAAAVSVPHANGPYKFGKVLHIQLLLGTSKGSSLKGGRRKRSFWRECSTLAEWNRGQNTLKIQRRKKGC